MASRYRPARAARPTPATLVFTQIQTMASAVRCDHHELVTSVDTALPVVDLREEPDALRERLRSVAHDVGFFHLTGHGVPAALPERVLESARRLFALPQPEKDAG